MWGLPKTYLKNLKANLKQTISYTFMRHGTTGGMRCSRKTCDVVPIGYKFLTQKSKGFFLLTLTAIFDRKLTWKVNIEESIKKAILALYGRKGSIGKIWGLSLRVVVFVSNTIIKPTLMDAVIACRNSLERIASIKKLEFCTHWNQWGTLNYSYSSA